MLGIKAKIKFMSCDDGFHAACHLVGTRSTGRTVSSLLTDQSELYEL